MLKGLAYGFGGFFGFIVLLCLLWRCCCGGSDDNDSSSCSCCGGNSRDNNLRHLGRGVAGRNKGNNSDDRNRGNGRGRILGRDFNAKVTPSPPSSAVSWSRKSWLDKELFFFYSFLFLFSLSFFKELFYLLYWILFFFKQKKSKWSETHNMNSWLISIQGGRADLSSCYYYILGKNARFSWSA